MLGTVPIDRLAEGRGAKLRAVVRRDGFEIPAGRRQIPRDAIDERGGEPRRVIERRDLQLASDKRAGHVDRGVLPDPAPSATQPADVEAIELHEIARVFGVKVHRRRGRPRLRLGWGGLWQSSSEGFKYPKGWAALACLGKRFSPAGVYIT